MGKGVGILIILVVIIIIIAMVSGQGGVGGSVPLREPSKRSFFDFTLAERDERVVSSSRTGSQTSTQPSKEEEQETRESYEERLKRSIRLLRGNAKKDHVNEEYIEILYSGYEFDTDKPNILLNGWSLENKRGEKFVFGGITELPYAGQINQESAFVVKPSSRIIVTTGASPLPANFRTNMCTGYFNQFNEFFPALKQDCPRPKDEPGKEDLQDVCLDYIDQLPRCKIPLTNPPFKIKANCTRWITENVGYAGCVENHKADAGFYKNEYRVYLGRPQEVWLNTRDTIILRDARGNVINMLEYK